MQASGKSRGRIAIEFINRLAEKVLSLGKTPIVWHDMLANVWKDGDMGEAGNYDDSLSSQKTSWWPSGCTAPTV